MLNTITEHLELEDCTAFGNNILQIHFKHMLCVRAYLMTGLKTHSNLRLHSLLKKIKKVNDFAECINYTVLMMSKESQVKCEKPTFCFSYTVSMK